MPKKMFEPLRDYVALKEVKNEKSIIAIPETAEDTTDNRVFEVIAIGPGLRSATGEKQPIDDIKVGDLVACTHARPFDLHGDEYLYCTERELICVKRLR